MTQKQPDQPLRGEAAWKAAKQRVADSNEAAYKRGREQRAESEAKAQASRRSADRKDAEQLPVQPTPLD